MHNYRGLVASLFLLILCSACFQSAADARTIHIVGDSTASTYGEDVYPRMGWGQVLSSFYGSEYTVVNLAQSGRSSKSFIEEGFFDQLEAGLNPGDILLIQFGHNDQKLDSPDRYAAANTDYPKYLSRYVALARDHQVTPVLVTPVVRRKFVDGELVATHGAYPQAVRDLSKASGVALIDANQLTRKLVSDFGEQPSKSLYLHFDEGLNKQQDDSHFSEYGAYRVAAIIATELDRIGLVKQVSQSPTIIRVEQDGSGDFTHVQQALEHLNDSREPAIILIGEGLFEEQLLITRDNIAFVGQGRDKTTLKTTLLRANWRAIHDDDWGASTVNIKASDLTFMRLRVVNDYGIARGDNSHQFAMRLLEGTRIITEDSAFITGGADTVSLWNKDSGQYYHRRAYFEGYTDFVCPRGWSYITDSEFFSRGGAAAIWHDGQRQKSQKLVIKNSSFDGVSNFILGRRHYDAQFYLINNRYSKNLADQAIFRVSYNDKSKNRANLWGDRAYYFGSSKEGKPYSWLNDNISHEQANISAQQTFNGLWDPERKLAKIKASIARSENSLSHASEAEVGLENKAHALASQHIKRFPKPWLMRKSDGAYVWSYTHGLVLLGMQQLDSQHQSSQYLDYIKSYVDHFVDQQGKIESYKMDQFNIDSISAGRLLFKLFERTGDVRYRRAIESLRTQLKWQPRTQSGGFWHKRKYPWQIWLDGLYMGQPFYAQYQARFGSDPAAFDDIVDQFIIIEQKTRDQQTGLLYHAWDESKLQPWADPTTGRSAAFWSRAMGWYAMALVDTIEYLPEGHAGRQSLNQILVRLVDALAEYQHASGLWYQVTDQGDRAGNWLEASASSMFTYSIAKGVRLGLLDAHYGAIADRAYGGLMQHIIRQDPDGRIHVIDVCRSAGLGGEPYRSGSYDYYVSTDRVDDDAHGIGAFLLAASEMARLTGVMNKRD